MNFVIPKEKCRKSISAFEHPNCDEYFVSIEAPKTETLQNSVTHVVNGFRDCLRELGLTEQNVARLNFFASDLYNAKSILRDEMNGMRVGLTSFRGQAPAHGGKVGLQAYLLKNGKNSIRITHPQDNITRVTHGKYTSHHILSVPDTNGSAYTQTEQVFSEVKSYLEKNDMTISDNLHRTWIFVRDIDYHYKDLVDARRKLFLGEGLRPETHYIASTGIEGKPSDPQTTVTMESLAISGLNKKQIHYIRKTDQMCSTDLYNVTFERGTKIIFGDREHIYISGTASIDANGNILFLQDVVNQTHRSLDNVEALLGECGIGLWHLSQCCVYLRDVSDLHEVKKIVTSRVPSSTMVIYLVGAVCRPGWLVEIEGKAIVSKNSEFEAFA